MSEHPPVFPEAAKALRRIREQQAVDAMPELIRGCDDCDPDTFPPCSACKGTDGRDCRTCNGGQTIRTPGARPRAKCEHCYGTGSAFTLAGLKVAEVVQQMEAFGAGRDRQDRARTTTIQFPPGTFARLAGLDPE